MSSNEKNPNQDPAVNEELRQPETAKTPETPVSKPGKAAAKTAREARQRKEEKRSNILYASIAVIFVVVAASALIWNSGVLQRGTTAAVVNGEKYSAAEVQYYYGSVYQSFINSNYYYLSYLGLDTSRDMREQTCTMDSSGMTWFDYFSQQALQQMSHVHALAAKAEAAGFTWNDEMQKMYDSNMAQLEANKGIVAHYARAARAAGFKGLFMVLSDPVDQLCQAAYQASNRNEEGAWDGLGLLPEQVQGYGLGVMTARAAYYARQDRRFASYLTEGRSFGPHGRGLLIANSVEHYDDALSMELTEKTVTANLKMREIGFKPYVAPAVSSGAMQLLLTLRGQWHCGSVCLGGVWFGVRNRYTPHGLEVETLELPDALYARLRQPEEILRSIHVE